MARSDKVQFRREFTLTSNGYAGDDAGFFVGDIASLHVDFTTASKISYLITGRVGRTGEWEEIKKGKDEDHLENINIRKYEYFRLEIFNVESSTAVVIFGYESNAPQSDLQVIQSERDFKLLSDSASSLKKIEKELKKLNLYMEIITGDKL